MFALVSSVTTGNKMTIGALALLLSSSVSAHTVLFEVGPDDSKMNQAFDNSPVQDVTSKNMQCGPNQAKVNKVSKIKAGDSLTMKWGHGKIGDDIMDSTHKGPCNTYMAKLTGDTPPTDGWFKIAESVGDGKKWCTEIFIDNKGVQTIKIPSSIPDGKYIVRSELLALHGANGKGGAQFYMGCAAIEVSGGTGSYPTNTVSIPGYLKDDDPSVFFDLYNKSQKDYKNPGPPVATLESSTGSGGSGAAVASAVSSGAAPPPSASPAKKHKKHHKKKKHHKDAQPAPQAPQAQQP